MVIDLFGIGTLCLFLIRGPNVVWTEVQRSDHVEGDLAVKPEALEPDRGDFFAGLVQGTNLCSAQRLGSIGVEGIGEAGLTDCGDEEAMLIWEQERRRGECYATLLSLAF